MLNSQTEVWKTSFVSENYQVSNHGRVKSLARYVYCGPNKIGKKYVPEKILKLFVCKTTGYLQCGINRRKFNVHILVAHAFLDKRPSEKHQVNHIDSDRKNSHISNLEWVTSSENHLHSYKMNNRKNAFLGKFGKNHYASKPVRAINLKNNEVLLFDCGMDAIRTGYAKDSGAITRSCQGKIKHHNGFKWEYVINSPT